MRDSCLFLVARPGEIVVTRSPPSEGFHRLPPCITVSDNMRQNFPARLNPMNRRQQNQAQAFLRSSEFAATLLADFTHEPPTKVDVKLNSARARLIAAIEILGGKQAIQAGGSFSEETEKQRKHREELEDELEDINASADSIAAEIWNPSLMERFRMPDGNSDSRLIAKRVPSPPPSASLPSMTSSRPTDTLQTPPPISNKWPPPLTAAKASKALPSASASAPPPAFRTPSAPAPPPSRPSTPSSAAFTRRTPPSSPHGKPPTTSNATHAPPQPKCPLPLLEFRAYPCISDG